jgi:hypothetical protein
MGTNDWCIVEVLKGYIMVYPQGMGVYIYMSILKDYLQGKVNI